MSESKASSHGGLTVLGEHSCVPEWIRSPEAWRGTILEGSGGKLPPYVLVMGDRRRVSNAAKLLTDAVILPEVMAKVGGTIGRVNVAVGLYKGTPIALVEHGMGPPSTEILVREVISSQYMQKDFSLSHDGKTTRFNATAKYVIRVGSAAGINKREPTADDVTIDPFDVIVTSHQVGLSGTDMQELSGRTNYFDPQMVERARDAAKKLGFSQESDTAPPTIDASRVLCDGMTQAARELIEKEALTLRCHVFGNYTKDSLYLENVEEDFVSMREHQQVGSSEMEFSTIARVARQHTVADDPVEAGMVLVALGTIPGEGFHHDRAKEALGTRVALTAALEALHAVSQQHME